MSKKLFGQDAIYDATFIDGLRSKLTNAGVNLDAIKVSIEQAAGSNAVEVSSVLTDNYQRHTDEIEAKLAQAAVFKIAKDFNIKAYRSAMIGRDPQGNLYGLDGVHRLLLAHAVGAEKVAAETVDVADAREAALIFDKVNAGRRAVSPHSKARAVAMIDTDSVEADIESVLKHYGYSLSQQQIGGVALAKKMIATNGRAAFDTGVYLHSLAWPTDKLFVEVAYALFEVMIASDRDSDDLEDLVEMLQTEYKHPQHLMNGVVVKGSGHNHGANRVQAMAEHIVKLYNESASDKIDRKAFGWNKPKKAKHKAKKAKVIEKAA